MVRIITDTASDISATQAADMKVKLVPLKVNFTEAVYDQAADEDFSRFFELLVEAKELPTTSMPAPGDYLTHFEAAREAGDDVLVITLSSGLSGTWQSAMIAKEMSDYEDHIFIVDSLQALIGQRLLVERAVAMKAEGKTAAEMAEILSEDAKRVRIYGALDTLKYLRKGGRIPKTTELIGSALGIKPIISLDSTGAIVTIGKARGRAGAEIAMLKIMEDENNFDLSVPVYFGYTQNNLACRSLRKLAMQKFKLPKTPVYPVGTVIGTHVGPGAFAVAWLVKE